MIKRMLADYFRRVVVYWYGFVIGVASGTVGAIGEIRDKQMGLPDYLWWIISIVALFLAQVAAFKDVWLDLEAERGPLRDLPLNDLIQRVYPQWASTPNPNGPDAVAAFIKRVRQEAVDGRLTVWGRLGEGNHYPLVEIPKADWINMQVDWFSVMRAKPAAEPLNQITGVQRRLDLHIASSQSDRIWPVKSKRKISLRSPISVGA
jgi:hypothetical protein